MTRQGPPPVTEEFIAPLDMNGLSGRMLIAPSLTKRTREILAVYGHAGQLERCWPLVQNLRRYGRVTVPDLPGFGGMQSFYRIGRRPTIDNYADYLAAFIKLRYKRRRITIVAVSFGFVVITRMLQRYPELVAKTDIVISLEGLIHADDIALTPARRRILWVMARVLSVRPLAFVLQRAVTTMRSKLSGTARILPAWLRNGLKFDTFANDVTAPDSSGVRRVADLSSHYATLSQMLKLDNCRHMVELPVMQLYFGSPHRTLIDHAIAKQHLLIAYRSCQSLEMSGPPSIGFGLPVALRQALR